MESQEYFADRKSSANTSGAWIFRGLIVALAGVVLLAVLSLGFYGWRVNQQRALVERIDKFRSWMRIEVTSKQDVHEQPWIERVLGKDWELPGTAAILLATPFASDFRSNLDEITRLVHLETLGLSGAPFGDDDLHALSQMRLTGLDLTATDITDAGVETLASWPRLEHLDLSATEVTDQGLAPVANMKTLTSLVLRDSKVTAAAVQRIRALRPDLEITHVAVKDAGHFAVVREITKRGGGVASRAPDDVTLLIFSGNPKVNDWKDFNWSRLKYIPNVISVSLMAFDRADEVLASVSHQPLRILRLEECPVSEGLVERIAKCRRLEHLHLRQCGLQPIHLQQLKSLEQLQTLSVSDLRIGPRELSAVASLPKLTRVELRKCAFDDGVFGSLELPQHWETLELFSGNVTDRDIENIARCKSLKEVNLIGNRAITDASVDTLLTLPLLERAAVGATAVTPAGEERLNDALQKRRDSRTSPSAN